MSRAGTPERARRIRAPGFRGAVMAALFALAISVAAEDPQTERARYEAELKELRAAIEELEATIRAKQGDRSEAQKELERIERELDDIARRHAETQSRIEDQQARVDALEAEQDKAREALSEEREALSREAQVAYQQGRALPFRILLSAETPDQAARASAYHAYFAEFRSGRISDTVEALEGLRARQEQLNAERRTLERLQERLAEERRVLNARAETRQELIAELREEIQGNRAEREQLADEAESLEELLRGLDRTLEEGDFDAPTEDFAELEGSLPWPAESNGIDSERRGGVLLPVAAGAEVHAVARGRVVYANWLQGMGMLMILDHGNGYMTLYGGNETLLREPGEWVESGERIALAPEAPGPDGARIHFEIRHQGDPVQAAGWLRDRDG